MKKARSSRDDATKVQQAGVDPAQRRQIEKLEWVGNADASAEAVARRFHQVERTSWRPRNAARWHSILGDGRLSLVREAADRTRD